MAKRKTRRKAKAKGQTLAQIKKGLRDGECTTVENSRGDTKTFCKLGGKVRESKAPT